MNDNLNLHAMINKKYFCPTIFEFLYFILMNSNSFYHVQVVVQVRKNYFFEFKFAALLLDYLTGKLKLFQKTKLEEKFLEDTKGGYYHHNDDP